jgi:uncharacterized protein YbjT (DUF2867 family)
MNTERIFVTGATGNIGSHLVKRLIEEKVNTTIYVRDEQKAKDMFVEEFKSGLLQSAKGDLSDTEAFRNAIQGHTRLFLLVTALEKWGETKGALGTIAYESGVKQIIDISAFLAYKAKRGLLSYNNISGEEALFKAANETGNYVVILRAGDFMTNHLRLSHPIKSFNKISGVGSPDIKSTLIDPRDIADVAVSIFLDPLEKHGTYVYDVNAQVLSNRERAQIFSKVLGREIVYEQVDIQKQYEHLIKFMSHRLAYDYLNVSLVDFIDPIPQLSVLTKKPLRTFEQWLIENRQAFE